MITHNIDILRQPHCPDNTLIKPGMPSDAGYDLSLADDVIIPPLSQVPREMTRIAPLSAINQNILDSIGYKEGALPKGSPYTIKDDGLWQMQYNPPLFRTGIHTLPRQVGGDGVWFMVCLRSSTSTRTGLRLHNSIGVIDNEYQGEILLALYSAYEVPIILLRGERVAQLIPMTSTVTNLFMGTDVSILQVRDGRGGGWGSTSGTNTPQNDPSWYGMSGGAVIASFES
jgi:dUTPase